MNIVATAYQVSESDKGVIEDELATAFEFTGMLSGERITLADMTCSRFFQEYWRTLTADRSYDESVEYPKLPEIPRFTNPFSGW